MKILNMFLKSHMVMVCIFTLATTFAAEPTVTDVTAKQRYPWNGLVDITCKVTGIDGSTNGLKFAVAAVIPDSGNVRSVWNFWVVQNGKNLVSHKVHTNGTYRLVWDAQADLGTVVYSNMVTRVTVVETHGKVQLWEGGPYWSDTNIGAEEPWEYGYYFWWGDTVGYKWENNAWVASDGSLSNFSFGSSNTPTYGKSIATLKSEGWITADEVLAPEHDAAHVHWGGSWRMPTDAEFSALVSNCTTTWTTTNGVYGRLVTGKGAYANRSIFLPAAGYGEGSSLYSTGSCGYCNSSSSTPDPDDLDDVSVWYLYFASLDFNRGSSPGHFFGHSVRPVQGFTESAVTQAGESAPYLLDTVTPLITNVVDSTSVSWDASWIGGDADATVVIADNGTEVKRTTGVGEFMYALPSAGQHELTYTTYIGDVAQDEVYTATFRRVKALAAAMVGDVDDVIYSGLAFCPEPTVTDSERGVTLVKGTDYTLSWGANTSAGSGSVTVTGKGNYTGAVTKNFTIEQRDIADAVVTLGGGLTYNGQEQTQSISSVKVDGLTVTYTVSDNKATDPGTYTLTVTGTGNFTGTATKDFSIARKSIAGATVTLGGGLTYTGAAQSQSVSSVTIDGLNATFDVSGNSATAVGIYTLTVTGTGKFTGSTTKQFTVSPKALTAAMVGTVGNVTYTGSTHRPEPTVTDAARGVVLVKGTDYTLSWGENVLAGSGSVTVTARGNYAGMIQKTFTIGKQVVPLPTIASKQYSGGQQLATVPTSTLYDVAQNAGGVEVGQYDVKLRLVDSSNYAWPDVSGTDKIVTFSITKAANEWTVEPSIAGWTYGQAANVPNMGTAKFGTAGVTYSATPQKAGNYTATFTVVGTANYEGLTKDVPFTIAKATYDMSGARWDYAGEFTYDGSPKTVLVSGLPNGVTVSAYTGNTATEQGTYTAHATLAYDTANYNAPSIDDLQWSIKSSDQGKIEEVFEDLPVTIEPDGDGGWTVTLTNDIDSADLPLEIPDNVGHLTLDLNGHNLVGLDGQDAPATGETPVVPGGDGRPAIVIVPGTGDGDATRLSLVTTGGDSLVKGGDGGDGNPGGNGAPAIEVADGAKGDVKVDVGAGVTVRGGDGGSSMTGRGGDGGAGIDGNVGTNDGTIIGGNGGDSVSGDGGDGGMGVTGDVGTNNGTISGGAGGVSAQGEDGEDGKPVGGTIGGGTGTVRKVPVPVPEVPSAAYTGEALAPAVPASGLYAVSASGGTRPGSYPVMLTLLDAANYEWEPREGATINGALAVVNFVIVEPPPSIEAAADDVAATYDGRGYGISVSVAWPPSGATVRYARLASGPFADEKPLFTNATDAAETWYEVSAPGFDPVTNVARVTVAPRSLANAALESLRFEDVGGVRTPVPSLVDDLGHGVPSADYAFVWNEEANGTMTLSFTGRGNYLGTFTARLAQTRFHVTFDANGGELDAEDGADFDIGTYYGVLPVPTRAGYLFDGWYEHADFSGEPVTRNTEVIAQDLTLHAKWLRRKLWYADATFHLEGAAQYNGYLVNSAAGDVVVGTIQVKAGKPSKKTGASKLTVTVQIAGEKKATLKVTTFDGSVTGTVGGRALDLALGFSSMSGTLGPYAIDGSRDVFTAKDADSKLVAAQALKRWQGVYTVAWKGAAGWNGLSIDVKAKGKAKVAGTLADGTKVSAKSLLLVGERECALAVSWTKKASSVACLVWFREDGTVECGNLPGGASALIANLRKGATLAAGSAFRIDPVAMAAAVPGLQADLLPDGLEVRMKGTSFEVDKPGKVKLLQDKSGVDLSKAGTNPSGLKLKYTVKNGTFKGSFSAYALSGGKLTKVKVSVSGVVLGGRGYGTASARKVGS